MRDEPPTPPAGGRLVLEGGLPVVRSRLLAWFRRLGLGLHDAEDCAQDTWLRVQRSGGADPPRPALVWVVARSVYVDWCRRHRVRRRASPEDLQAAVTEPAPPTREHELLDLRGAMERLPPRLAAVLELTVGAGLSYREAAERLGIPRGTVKSRMYHAVRRLRRELGHEA